MQVPESYPTKDLRASSATPAATDHQLSQQMAKLGEVLQNLETVIAQFSYSNEKHHYQINNKMIAQAHQAVTKASQQLTKLQKQETAQANESEWQKILGILLPVISAVACLFSPEAVPLLVTMMVFLVAQKTGALKAASKGIGDLLHSAFGIPKSIGDLVGTLAIIVASIAITHKASASSFEDAADEAGSSIASSAANTADETTQESTSLFAKAKGVVNNVSKQTSMDLLVGGTAMTDSPLVQNIVGISVQYGHLSAKQKQELEIALTVLVSLLALVGAGLSSNALLKSGSEATRLGSALRGFAKALPKAANGLSALGEMMPSATSTLLFRLLMGANAAGSGAQVGLDAKLAHTELEMADLMKGSGEEKALTELYQELARSGDNTFSSVMHTEGSQLSGDNQALASLGHAYSGTNAAVAREIAG